MNTTTATILDTLPSSLAAAAAHYGRVADAARVAARVAARTAEAAAAADADWRLTPASKPAAARAAKTAEVADRAARLSECAAGRYMELVSHRADQPRVRHYRVERANGTRAIVRVRPRMLLDGLFSATDLQREDAAVIALVGGGVRGAFGANGHVYRDVADALTYVGSVRSVVEVV